MRVLGTLFSIALTLVTPAPLARLAQASDPDPDSPPGVIYEIPLDAARRYAAPYGGGALGGPAGSGGGRSGELGSAADRVDGGATAAPSSTSGSEVIAAPSPSSIHSENGFGSSSRVPGAPAGRRPGNEDPAASGGAGQRAGDTDAAARAERPIPVSTGGAPSTGRGYLLIALALAVAGGLSLAGRHAARDR